MACFSRCNQGKQNGNRNKYNEDEDSDDGEDGRLVCTIIGQGWGVLPFPVVVDSGVNASVMPQDWCPHVPTTQTRESEHGGYFRAAHGNNARVKRCLP